ncbi:hypothetical protein ANN_14365 [Periplaneta americana]|uniref:Uncharacterized protein n=1 Tax=Periplaneta americana TaxID=6978 RepID=A0ABQ8SY83_PERAM|nr:hypothetical protein ANN_14365 [Periplaneta americana]
MEYGTTCWDPYRIYQINSLERIQYRAAKFVKGKREDGNDTIKELKWEILENRLKRDLITPTGKWANEHSRLYSENYDVIQLPVGHRETRKHAKSHLRLNRHNIMHKRLGRVLASYSPDPPCQMRTFCLKPDKCHYSAESAKGIRGTQGQEEHDSYSPLLGYGALNVVCLLVLNRVAIRTTILTNCTSTESYPAFARIGLRENPGKNLNQVTCPDRDSNPGHLVSQPDALTTGVDNLIGSSLPFKLQFKAQQCKMSVPAIDMDIADVFQEFMSDDITHRHDTTVHDVIRLLIPALYKNQSDSLPPPLQADGTGATPVEHQCRHR